MSAMARPTKWKPIPGKELNLAGEAGGAVLQALSDCLGRCGESAPSMDRAEDWLEGLRRCAHLLVALHLPEWVSQATQAYDAGLAQGFYGTASAIGVGMEECLPGTGSGNSHVPLREPESSGHSDDQTIENQVRELTKSLRVLGREHGDELRRWLGLG
ncbi:hypothetical protein SB768_30650 [Burkholderia sp. SIMBA_043]|uniref:hypothetical protein n=1 Tax=Burkholderia TaxID=32008 RepID=UPI0011854C15|nr:hypothetical protein [Burkholderia vietnamiensis]UBI28879.1 hypothetical protein LA325_27030 [Burkholderia vietnamiensis]